MTEMEPPGAGPLLPAPGDPGQGNPEQARGQGIPEPTAGELARPDPAGVQPAGVELSCPEPGGP